MTRILVIIQRVQVERVTYSYHVVKTVEDLTLMKPYLIERVDSIETVLPTVTTPNDGDYAYISASSCKAAFRRALDDTIKEEIPIEIIAAERNTLITCSIQFHRFA